MQQLDPPGVAARDLKECLLLQLIPACRTTTNSGRSSHHLEDLEYNRLPQISKNTGYTSIASRKLGRAAETETQTRAQFTEHGAERDPRFVASNRRRRQIRVRLEDTRTPHYVSQYYRRLLNSETRRPKNGSSSSAKSIPPNG